MSLSFRNVTIITILLLSGCDNEPQFSCDPTVDAFVKNKLDELTSIERRELVKYATGVQRAVFRAKTAEQQFGLWSTKYHEMLSSPGWSESEKNHIRKVSLFLDRKFFEAPTEHENLIKAFINEWGNYGAQTFKWDNRTLFLILNTLYIDRQEVDAAYKARLRSSARTVSSEEDCECSDPQGVIIKDCDLIEPNCDEGATCTILLSGCGSFYLSSCRGLCTSDSGE